MNFITSIEFARKNNISPRMVAYYCQKGQIPEAIKKAKHGLFRLRLRNHWIDVEKATKIQ